MDDVDDLDERPTPLPLTVSVNEDGTGYLSTPGGRIVYHDHEWSAMGTRRRIDGQLALLGPTTRAASATTLDLGALPSVPDDLDVDHEGRWAAVGGSTDGTVRTGPGWCAIGRAPGVAGMPDEGELRVHRIGEDVVVVDRLARGTTVRTLRADGTQRHVFRVAWRATLSAATDTSLVLASGHGAVGRLTAFLPTGEVVFDFDRDMTVPVGPRAVQVTSGPPAEDLVTLSHVAGGQVAWMGDDDHGVVHVLDMAARRSREVPIPELFGHADLLTVTPDGAVIARLVDEELWTWRPPGPIVRTRLPPHRGARALHGGRVAIWDDRRALVIDPPPPGG
jgi:hypothetical protein